MMTKERAQAALNYQSPDMTSAGFGVTISAGFHRRVPVRQFSVDPRTLLLTPGMILREMGYGGTEAPAAVQDLVVSMLHEVKGLVTPSFAFVRLGGVLMQDRVRLEDGTTFTPGKIIARLLGKSQSFVLFTATAGTAFHDYQRRVTAEGDILRSFAVDTIGNCLVEAVCDRMELQLELEIAPLRHTNRFSPGYCGWKLAEQRTLFNLLGGNPCGISLSDMCLMTPEKSVSGIVGLGTDVGSKLCGCHFCDRTTCSKRKRQRHQA